MYNNIKSKMCIFYLKNTCKYESKNCIYAHGVKELYKIDCNYGIHCNKSNCNYYHGKIINDIKEIEVPILDIINSCKNKSKKKLQNKYYNNFKYIKQNVDEDGNFNKNILNKEYKKHKKTISLNPISEDVSKKYYLELISKKDFLISKYKDKIIKLEKKYTDLKNRSTIKELDKTQQSTKTINKYNKYLDLYNIINSNNKNIEEKLKKITNDKNLSKLKIRCKRVKEYMDIVKEFNIKNILPISILLNSTKHTFSILKNNYLINK